MWLTNPNRMTTTKFLEQITLFYEEALEETTLHNLKPQFSLPNAVQATSHSPPDLYILLSTGITLEKMGRRRERNELSSLPDDKNEESNPPLENEPTLPSPSPTKKRKTLPEDSNDTEAATESQIQTIERPKSKKELRSERKMARLLAKDPKAAAALLEAEKRRLIEAQKKEKDKEEFRQILREEREVKKARQQKKLNREKNARSGGQGDSETKNESKNKSKKVGTPQTLEEDAVARKIMDEIKYGTSDTSGWTTVQLGVKYKDVVVGKGNLVQTKSLVTVKYQLKGGQFGVVLDSSKNFIFRVEKGEVIQGWDIGVMGMREGGQRKLIVPPKAGYGAKDIGAGPGGLLNFDITVIAVRV
jgi:FKBP-type peptidyl-prolyl cis-trans isomerase